MRYIFSAPAWCPLSLDKPRFSAHLPLPSGTMATWTGSLANFFVVDALPVILMFVVGYCGVGLDLYDFCFFASPDLFDTGYKAVGKLL